MRFTRLLVPALVLVLPIAALGCRGKASPTPEAPTAAPVEAGQWPTLTVVSPTVQFRAHEEDALRDVAPDEAVQVQPGGNAVVGPNGHAVLAWKGFLTNDLLSGADVLVSLSLATQREVLLDQAKGTVRYVLQGPGTPAKVQVKADWAQIEIDQGTADLIVSVVPGTEPAVWVAALDGSGQVTRGTDVLTVAAGQVVAVTERGTLGKPTDIDRAAVQAWFDDLAKGTAEGEITVVAFRCTVTATTAPVLVSPDPDAKPVGAPLDAGTVVSVLGRDAGGAWVYVRPVASGKEGWVSVDNLSCIGPVDQVKPIAVESTPTPTLKPRPTRVIIVTPTLAGTLTPTPTPTAGNYTINFWATDNDVAEGSCTQLKWETANIREVYYQGKGVPGNGSSDECPEDTTTYRLRVILTDGSEQNRSAEVKVHQAKSPTKTSPPPASNTPPPQPSETPAPPPASNTPPPPSDTPPASGTTLAP